MEGNLIVKWVNDRCPYCADKSIPIAYSGNYEVIYDFIVMQCKACGYKAKWHYKQMGVEHVYPDYLTKKDKQIYGVIHKSNKFKNRMFNN